MDPVASKQTKVFLKVFILLVLITTCVTYYRYMIKDDFIVTESDLIEE